MGSVEYCQVYNHASKTNWADQQLGNFIMSYGFNYEDSYKMVDIPGHCLLRLDLHFLFDEVNVTSNVINVYAHILNLEEAAQNSSRYFANASVVHRIAALPLFEKKTRNSCLEILQKISSWMPLLLNSQDVKSSYFQ